MISGLKLALLAAAVGSAAPPTAQQLLASFPAQVGTLCNDGALDDNRAMAAMGETVSRTYLPCADGKPTPDTLRQNFVSFARFDSKSSEQVTLANLTALAKAQASLVKPGSGSLARRGTYTDASGKIVTVFMSKTVLALPGGRAMINSGVSFVRGNIVISATGHARDAAKYPETVDLDGMMKLVTQKAFGRLKPSQPLKDVVL